MPFSLEIDNSFVIENDDFIVYATQSLQNFAESSFRELVLNKKRILDCFRLENFRKVTMILFDDLSKFRKYVLSLRDENSFLPDYAIGVFDKGMIISYIDIESIKDNNQFNNKSKTSIHEFIHIVNREQVYKKRVIWLDEGLATNLDNKRADLTDINSFKNFFIEKILTIKELPIVNDLKHGTGFKNDNYDAYDLVYLCVRFLIEKMDKEEFQNLLRDYEFTNNVGKTVLKEAIEYYKNKLNIQ